MCREDMWVRLRRYWEYRNTENNGDIENSGNREEKDDDKKYSSQIL